MTILNREIDAQTARCLLRPEFFDRARIAEGSRFSALRGWIWHKNGRWFQTDTPYPDGPPTATGNQAPAPR
jgi:hypothetical protein